MAGSLGPLEVGPQSSAIYGIVDHKFVGMCGSLGLTDMPFWTHFIFFVTRRMELIPDKVQYHLPFYIISCENWEPEEPTYLVLLIKARTTNSKPRWGV